MTPEDMAGESQAIEETREAFARAVSAVRNGADPSEEAANLYGQMTDEERVWVLSGDLDFWPGMRSFVEDG